MICMVNLVIKNDCSFTNNNIVTGDHVFVQVDG